ncbi:uncharacterized protein LOC134232192 [Saccostrea cucullata]|uniref:uncharacterized protein LOC134232192 n=1 Tax=Saccostrea cuccullata TaxID=36930 RepID=UPI002ED190E7
MLGSVLLVLCLLRIGDVALGHNDLRNVAYGKSVILSSNYHSSGYSGSKVVNGLLTDLSHTAAEKTPYLVIDLGKDYVIHEIEVFARKCCVHQLHDFDVKVGQNTHTMHLCGHYTGYAKLGERIAMWCPADTVGRYVKIQITSGVSNVLTPAEVLVWGHL